MSFGSMAGAFGGGFTGDSDTLMSGSGTVTSTFGSIGSIDGVFANDFFADESPFNQSSRSNPGASPVVLLAVGGMVLTVLLMVKKG